MTVITESFDKADGAGLGPDLTWTETNGTWTVVSNQANAHSTTSRARAESDLATSDHYAQAVWAGTSSTNNKVGLCVRYSSAANTCYRFSYQKDGSVVTISKLVSGTSTTLATTTGPALNTNDVLYFEATGSALVGKLNGAIILTVADGSITTGRRCGIEGISSVADRVKLDSFEAGDILVPETAYLGAIPI